MKVPLSWMSDFIDLSLSPSLLAEHLSSSGFEVEEVSGRGDATVLDVAVLPNRGDVLSMRGMARELGAILDKNWKVPFSQHKIKPLSLGRQYAKVTEPTACLRYMVLVVSGITVEQSPLWLKKRLELCGIRPINQIVDVTNYVLMELGHPLHAFDRSLIDEDRIEVRFARKGESLELIDHTVKKLDTTDLVIADGEKPVALAGIMGGAVSSISQSTTEIVLEAACFESSCIRRSARKHGLQTDSSYRFERGIPRTSVKEALFRAFQLIQQLCPGAKVMHVEDHDMKSVSALKRTQICFSPDYLEELIGLSYKKAVVKNKLKRLGLDVLEKTADLWDLTIPEYRSDLREKQDVVEEVLRLTGIDHIPSTIPSLRHLPEEGILPEEKKRRCVKDFLVHHGFQETIHYSFESHEDATCFLDSPESFQVIPVQNPQASDLSVMRTSLLPALLRRASFHHCRQQPHLRFFEFRNVYGMSRNKKQESRSLAGLICGRPSPFFWNQGQQKCDFYELKGVLESLFEHLSVQDLSFQGIKKPFLQPGRQAGFCVKEREIGFLGEIHPLVLEKFGLEEKCYVFELKWDLLFSCLMTKFAFKEYSRYPVVERDLSFVLDEGLETQKVIDCMCSVDPVHVMGIEVFDVYQGEKIPEGKKSVSFSIHFGSLEQTMMEDQIKGIFEGIIDKVRSVFNAELR